MNGTDVLHGWTLTAGNYDDNGWPTALIRCEYCEAMWKTWQDADADPSACNKAWKHHAAESIDWSDIATPVAAN